MHFLPLHSFYAVGKDCRGSKLGPDENGPYCLLVRALAKQIPFMKPRIVKAWACWACLLFKFSFVFWFCFFFLSLLFWFCKVLYRSVYPLFPFAALCRSPPIRRRSGKRPFQRTSINALVWPGSVLISDVKGQKRWKKGRYCICWNQCVSIIVISLS